MLVQREKDQTSCQRRELAALEEKDQRNQAVGKARETEESRAGKENLEKNKTR